MNGSRTAKAFSLSADFRSMDDWLEFVANLFSESKFWRVALPTAIGTLLGSWFFWSSLINAGRHVWAVMVWEVAIPLWLLSVLVLSALAWIGFFARRYQGRSEENEAKERETYEEEFTEALIEGIHWEWAWENGSPSSLTPLCPECGMEMDYGDDTHPGVVFPGRTVTSTIKCPSGHTTKRWRNRTIGQVLDLVKREVERQVREDEWR